jgi:hypothetical protein
MFFDLAFLDPAVELLQACGPTAAFGQLLLPQTRRAVLGLLPGLAVIFDHHQEVTRGGKGVEAEDLNGNRRTGLGQGCTQEVEHGFDLAVRLATHYRLPHLERPPLYQHGRHRAPTHVKLSLYDDPGRRGLGVGLEFFDFRHQQDHVHKIVEIKPLLCGDLHHDRVPAPSLRHKTLVGKLLLDKIRVGIGQIHLVDGYHHGHISGLGVAYGLKGLGHHAVVRSHHYHRDIGRLRPSGAHCRERFVPRSIEERHLPVVVGDLVGTDVLRDAARLALDHLSLTDGVQ